MVSFYQHKEWTIFYSNRSTSSTSGYDDLFQWGNHGWDSSWNWNHHFLKFTIVCCHFPWWFCLLHRPNRQTGWRCGNNHQSIRFLLMALIFRILPELQYPSCLLFWWVARTHGFQLAFPHFISHMSGIQSRSPWMKRRLAPCEKGTWYTAKNVYGKYFFSSLPQRESTYQGNCVPETKFGDYLTWLWADVKYWNTICHCGL